MVLFSLSYLFSIEENWNHICITKNLNFNLEQWPSILPKWKKRFPVKIGFGYSIILKRQKIFKADIQDNLQLMKPCTVYYIIPIIQSLKHTKSKNRFGFKKNIYVIQDIGQVTNSH